MLPGYIRRGHDDLLDAVLDPRTTANRLVVVRGDSSTGKSRAAYQAVMNRLPDWRVEYPATVAALAQRLQDGIKPRTVLWLNELRRYADEADAGDAWGYLAELLAGHGRIVVITTLWHKHWKKYTQYDQSAPGVPDRFALTRELLAPLPELTGCDLAVLSPSAGAVIDVPSFFSVDDLARAQQQADAALAGALAAARAAGAEGKIIQFLAGVDDLHRHYHDLGGRKAAYGQALITAAIDAARLGHPGPYSPELLQAAVIGYLSDEQRTSDLSAWWKKALKYATRKLKGAVRALEKVPPEHSTGTAAYNLAGYLEQHGSQTRQACLGPISLWNALAQDTSHSYHFEIGQAAHVRGLYRDAAIFYAQAIIAGRTTGALPLLGLLNSVDPEGVHDLVGWASDHIETANALAWWLTWLHPFRNPYMKTPREWADEAIVLFNRVVGRVAVSDPLGVYLLLWAIPPGVDDGYAAFTLIRRALDDGAFNNPEDLALVVTGAPYEVRVLLAEWAAEHVTAKNPNGIAKIMENYRENLENTPYDLEPDYIAQQYEPMRDLAVRAVGDVAVNDPAGVAALLAQVSKLGMPGTAAALAVRAASEIDVDEPDGVAELLKQMNNAGAAGKDLRAGLRVIGAARTLAEHVARIISIDAVVDRPAGVAALLDQMSRAGAGDAAAALASKVAGDIAVDGAADIAEVLDQMSRAGADGAAAALEARVVIEVPINDANGLMRLLDSLTPTAINTLAARAADCLSAANVPSFARLLGEIRDAGQQKAAATLMARAIASVDLGDPSKVAGLLRQMREAAAEDLVAALLDRHPADHAALDDPGSVARLFYELQTTGAHLAATGLAVKAAGHVTHGHLAFDDPKGVFALAGVLRSAGAEGAAAKLVAKAADQWVSGHAALDEPSDVAWLLEALPAVGADAAVTALASQAAGKVALDDSPGIAKLIEALHATGNESAATRLADRAAGEVALDDAEGVVELLRRMRAIGAAKEASQLAARAGDSGLFQYLFQTASSREAGKFRFGRELDGTPSPPWNCQDVINQYQGF